MYNEDHPVSKFIKGQYYTTNEFAEYYKNLVESKEKSSSSKISMLGWRNLSKIMQIMPIFL